MNKQTTGKLGTFAGVFTPSVLTILGIILFRRAGYLVGAAGLGQALLIVAMANVISVLTSVSLSAIATNFTVKGGGDYYLISRTLGMEFGGALGIVLFLAQSVSIAFYCLGFGEAVAGFFSTPPVYLARVIAFTAIVLLFFLAWKGADWATRFQYIVMAVLLAAIVSFFVGGIKLFDVETLRANWSANPATRPNFWLLFAIFFPAVTGFTQGVSMSGDLKDPGKSLPRGTFAAVGVSIVVYFACIVLFAGALPLEDLRVDYNAMRRVSVIGWLVAAGVIAATLSSAMASFLGAPRILQSLSSDKIFAVLSPFAKGAGPMNNPRRGVVLSLVIGLITIGLGNLNFIAPVVSMFFLISYGLLNYATWYEARANSPSFRPRFRFFDRRLSLCGAVACLGAMLAINPLAGGIGMAVLLAIYQYLRSQQRTVAWADSSRSYLFQRIKDDLFAMASEVSHPRDWRPQILAFSRQTERRNQLLRFASWIEGGAGLTSVVEILEGEQAYDPARREAAELELRRSIKALEVQAFPKVISSTDPMEGFRQLIQSYGVGPLQANITLYNWLERDPDSPSEAEWRYGTALWRALKLGCHLVVLDAENTEWEALINTPLSERRIDVWWRDDETSPLMLMLAHLMTRMPDWRDVPIRVLYGRGRRSFEKAEARLAKTLSDVRINADVEIVDKDDAETIVEQSKDASMAFLPFVMKNRSPRDLFGNPLDDLLNQLPIVALVMAAEDIGLDLEPDEGAPADVAEAVDEAERAAREAEEKQKAAERAARKAEKAAESEAADTVQQEAEKLARQAEKAQQAAEEKQQQAEDQKK
jgi:amino acid transporter